MKNKKLLLLGFLCLVLLFSGLAQAGLQITKTNICGEDPIPTFTKAAWILRITISNDNPVTQTNVIVKDVIPGEYTTGEDILFSYYSSKGNVNTVIHGKSTHITWDVGTLLQGESETLDIIIWTRFFNKQKFTKPAPSPF